MGLQSLAPPLATPRRCQGTPLQTRYKLIVGAGSRHKLQTLCNKMFIFRTRWYRSRFNGGKFGGPLGEVRGFLRRRISGCDVTKIAPHKALR